MGRHHRIRAALLAIAVTVIFAAPALAHIERTAFWPDPRPDHGVTPAAGGKVPKIRSLGSALRAKPAGRTRVVCQSDSLVRAKRDIRRARRRGYKVRPSQPRH